MRSILLYIVAVAFIGGGSMYLSSVSNNVSVDAVLTVQKPQHPSVATSRESSVAQKQPIHLSSDDLDMDLEISEGSYDHATGSWTVGDTRVYNAVGTTTPLLYGHNTNVVFADLSKADVNTRFTLHYSTSSEVYRYVATRFVGANDASIVHETNNPDTILLLTCSGIFNESRRIVYIERIA